MYHPDPNCRANSSPIGVILIGKNFFVKRVIMAWTTVPPDQKGGCTIPWHRFGLEVGCLEGAYDHMSRGCLLDASC